MRYYAWFVCAVTWGCSGPPASVPQFAEKTAPTQPVPNVRVEESTERQLATPAKVDAREHSRIVPDLGTRKQGSDWPGFLGPFGTSVSPEKGILSPWPRQGLRLVWQKQLGTGYAMPSISRGRLFLFD